MSSATDPNDPTLDPLSGYNTLLPYHGSNASNSASIPSASGMVPNSQSNPANQPSSIINLTNSNDVVIGAMSQYQGPVTIYQYMDATVEARAMQSNGGITNNQGNRSTSINQKSTRNSSILVVLLLIVIATAGVVTYYIYQSNNQQIPIADSSPKDIRFGNNYAEGSIPNLGNGHLVIDREQWGSSDVAVKTNRLYQPIPYVLITHIGVKSIPCFNVYKCSVKMRTIQDLSIAEHKRTDITANFYIGNDGYIYVGRGWYYTNPYANNSLAVCFMGDYNVHKTSEKQLEAIQFLLAYGVTNRHLSLDYKLVAHNQTKVTTSPGINVYKEIVRWPHWYPCDMNSKPKCGEEVGITNWEEYL